MSRDTLWRTPELLQQLLKLEPGWDSYGGSPIDPKCVALALKFVSTILPNDTSAPAVVPTSQGGVQLEWHTGGVDLEIEFVSATCIRGLFADCTDGATWEFRAKLVE